MKDLRKRKKLAIKVQPKDSKHKNFHKALADYLYKEFKHEGLPVKKRNIVLTVALKDNINNKYEKVVIDCLNGKMYLRGKEVKDKYWGKLRRFEGGQRASDAYHCVVQSAKRIINRIKKLEDQINEEDKEVYGEVTRIDLRKKKEKKNEIEYIVRRDMRTIKKANRKDLRKEAFGNLNENDIEVVKEEIGGFVLIGIKLINNDKKVSNDYQWEYYDNYFGDENIIGAAMMEIIDGKDYYDDTDISNISIEYLEVKNEYQGTIVFKKIFNIIKEIIESKINKLGQENIFIRTKFANLKLKEFINKNYPNIDIFDEFDYEDDYIIANIKDLRKKKYANVKDLRKISNKKPFIGIVTSNNEVESYNREEAEKHDYHHTFIFSEEGLQQFDNDDTLRFVVYDNNNYITIEGNSSLDPFGDGYKQIQLMAQEYNKYGFNMDIVVANQHMGTRYEGKKIGNVSDFLNNKYSHLEVKKMEKQTKVKDMRKKANFDIDYYEEAQKFIDKIKNNKNVEDILEKEINKNISKSKQYAVALAEIGNEEGIISDGTLNDVYQFIGVRTSSKNRIITHLKKKL
ncbi:MAG: hypothetical protein ACOCP8_05225 [archaeon]